MAKGISAKRHAQAVFDIAKESGELERWKEDLDTLAHSLSEPEVSAFLGNPKVRMREKFKILAGLLEGVHPLALNLAFLLVARGRLAIVKDIALEYEKMFDAQRGIEHAEVITAIPLSDVEKERIAQRISTVTGKQVTLMAKVEPGLLGGLVVKIGDRVLDGSIRSRLQSLKRSLIEAAP
ncbi:MAG: ATP synthase F1 subunit delta [Chloroflexi bacterium]|nr:ATP synthase F1 subunit delta [Chloroflexota bacterium]